MHRSKNTVPSLSPLVVAVKGTGKGFFARGAWTFRRGEQWVVSGPNGAGKSYLMALLAGEVPPRGIALTFGEGVEEHVVSVTFAQQQDQAAHGWLQARWHSLDDDDDTSTVRHFLSYEAVHAINPFEVRPAETAERRAFAQTLKKVGGIFNIPPLMPRRMNQLSNGEMRRTLLARALLGNPALLVLDDPFAGLDGAMRARLQTALNRLAAEGLPMVLTVRNDDEIPACATHRLLLKNGTLAGRKKRASSSGQTSDPCAVVPPFPAACVPAAPQRRPMFPVVELNRVTVRYGRRTVLRDITWTVEAGSRWLITGPNGSGKTTLLSLITGDNPAAYACDVRVFGHARSPGESLWPIRRRIGQVSPELQCYFDMDLPCLDAVLSGRCNAQGEIKRVTAAARASARGWLRKMGLEAMAHTPFGALSSGRQRLVLLARAMLPQPDLLLLDEPCLNLDTASKRHVLTLLSRLLESRRDVTVICVAHRSDDVPPGFRDTLRLPGPDACVTQAASSATPPNDAPVQTDP